MTFAVATQVNREKMQYHILWELRFQGYVDRRLTYEINIGRENRDSQLFTTSKR